MTVPPFGGGSTKGDRWLNALKRRWLTTAGNQAAYPVTMGNTTVTVTFLGAMATLFYGVIVTPNWNTTVWVTNKTGTNCVVNFGTAAPASAIIDVAVWADSRN
jgi:hypothetical protein